MTQKSENKIEQIFESIQKYFGSTYIIYFLAAWMFIIFGATALYLLYYLWQFISLLPEMFQTPIYFVYLSTIVSAVFAFLFWANDAVLK